MKKSIFILSVLFTLLLSVPVNACIGSLDAGDFFAEGTFNKSGHMWMIKTSSDGKIHYTVYDADGKGLVDNIISHSDAVYYANLFHDQGHGGPCD